MKKWICILLMLLCLTGCGSPELPEAEGIDRSAVLLTVDGRPVTGGTYLYWLGRICGALEEQYRRAGKTMRWEEPVEGRTLGAYAKNQALRSAALYATVENWAERYDCALSAEDRAALEVQWTERAEANGGEAAYLKLLAESGLDRTEAKRMAEDHYLYMALCALAETPDSALYASAGELDEWAGEQGYLTLRVLDLTGEDSRTRAAETFARLNSSEDPAAVFDELGAGAPRTVLPGDGSLSAVLTDAASALEPGQFSGILETEEGYALALRQRPDLELLRTAYFDHCLQAAADGAEVWTAEPYGALDVAGFWENAFQSLEN